MNKKFRVYPTITTTSNSNWRKKIQTISNLKLKEVCLFITGLNPDERSEAYKLLRKTKIEHIPLVHLKHDSTTDEIEYFIHQFGTKLFNIHSKKEFKLKYDLSPYKDKINLEFTLFPITDELPSWAGICLDTAHVENQRLRKNSLYESFIESLEKFPTNVWHVSAIKPKPFIYEKTGELNYDFHTFNKLSEFDYIKRYKKYIAPVIALELENSIEDQLKAKKYIEELLS